MKINLKIKILQHTENVQIIQLKKIAPRNVFTSGKKNYRVLYRFLFVLTVSERGYH